MYRAYPRVQLPALSDAIPPLFRYNTILHRCYTSRDRQKRYADKRRKPLEFQVGDRVLLKVSPWKGVILFGKQGKLNPRYIGPFEILKRIGPVAYQLNLPAELEGVHNVFYISNL
ncbi:hypothetical protein E3N88_44489 [Mikania micrantha]|uniref:Tf2-1-like SH3-like domain-containing protein n=1 Tax=Mikania micrantha TaxID=192012 RepID=A0A5N6LBV2_9ASTR|nr:hypothetical protein E3N88_44489 [Mikania micrantha]